ncbi:ParA family protein [Chondrinema litorale]|uniref:ParA family protein n=1 Tax=Chondrinema litorale TaxID=2994555 RepID=UPI0025431377|nr:ParA family protein [Chondrinema litorale]UZR99924.1 ParA family protein [Chondrinema litorale]
MITIAIVNNKGGVSKTTTAVNVGAGLAKKGKKVLLVDLDGQANLSQSLGVGLNGKSIYGVFKGSHGIEPKEINKNLHVMPASESLSELELELVSEFEREKFLKYALDEVKKNYDFAIIDCGPSKGLLTVNALTACDDIIIPLQSEFLAMQGVKSLTDLVFKVKKSLNPTVRILGVLITMYDKRKILNKSVASEISQHYPVFDTFIRENVSLAEAPTSKLDIFKYAPKSMGAKDYSNLTEEILSKYE